MVDESRPLLIYHGGLEILVLLATFGDLMVKRTAAATFAQLAVSDEYRLAIVAQECMKTLLGLAHVDDDEVRIWAIWTIASLAETGLSFFLPSTAHIRLMYPRIRRQPANHGPRWGVADIV